MPVRELTERPTIPRLGKIRLGDQSGRNGSPVNKPFFVCPDEVKAVYGEEPTELRVVFLSDDLERIASQYYRAYNASNGLVCKGDGYRADALLDADELKKRDGDLSQPFPLNLWAHGNTGDRGGATKNVLRQEIDCPGSGYDGQPACPAYAAKKCAVRTFLQFAIRDVPGLGVYQLDTGSIVSTKKINGAIEMAKQVVGGVAGIPMILRRVQQDVSPDGIKKKVWMVELEVDTEYSLANLIELRAGPVAKALLPPVDESEVYGPLDDEDDDAIEGSLAERTGHVEHGATQQETTSVVGPDSGDVSTPAAAPPGTETTPVPSMPRREYAPVAPIDLLNEIGKRLGNAAIQAAKAIMPMHFGTMDLLKLTDDDRRIYAGFLRTRLDDAEHTCELAYTANGRPVCSRCGCELTDEPEQTKEAPAQAALPT